MALEALMHAAQRAAQSLSLPVVAAAMAAAAVLFVLAKLLLAPSIPSITFDVPSGTLRAPWMRARRPVAPAPPPPTPRPHARRADITPPGRTRGGAAPDHTIPCYNPGTDELLGYAPAMTPEQVCPPPHPRRRPRPRSERVK